MRFVSNFPLLALSLMTCGLGACSTSTPKSDSINRETASSDPLAKRAFPSIFAPWASADNFNLSPRGTVEPLLGSEDTSATWARHDLIFRGPTAYDLQFNNVYPGLADGFTSESITQGLKTRANILRQNPRALLFAEIRYRDADVSYLPANSPWWVKDADGNLTLAWAEGNYYALNFTNPDLQKQVAAQCKAVIQTGVVDGCMFDGWPHEDAARIALIKGVRAAIGPDALIMVNANGNTPVLSAPYINAMYMEGFGSSFFNDWHKASSNLMWAKTHLQFPAITALEGWYPLPDPSEEDSAGRNDVQFMRMVTTLSLVFSDGYVLFSDPDSLAVADHGHDWYPFWNPVLGRPIGPQGVMRSDGAYSREYENGTVIFNPPGNKSAVNLQFPSPRTSQATGAKTSGRTIAAGDGDIFIN